jgi:hypothetical protein
MSSGPFTQRQVDQIRAIVREELAEHVARGRHLQRTNLEIVMASTRTAKVHSVRAQVRAEAQPPGSDSDG